MFDYVHVFLFVNALMGEPKTWLVEHFVGDTNTFSYHRDKLVFSKQPVCESFSE